MSFTGTAVNSKIQILRREKLMQAPTQNSKTKTVRLEENTLLDDSCLQLCPAFELLVCPDVSGY